MGVWVWSRVNRIQKLGLCPARRLLPRCSLQISFSLSGQLLYTKEERKKQSSGLTSLRLRRERGSEWSSDGICFSIIERSNWKNPREEFWSVLLNCYGCSRPNHSSSPEEKRDEHDIQITATNRSLSAGLNDLRGPPAWDALLCSLVFW